MRKIIFTLAVLAFAVPALAQAPVATNVTSDTAGTVAAIIKYIGTGTAATVEVDAATGDIEFEIANVDDSTNIDTAAVCAGGVANSLDVSDAQCDTFGEVADLINASTHWRMVLVSALRSDSTNNTLTTAAEASAMGATGYVLYLDSAVADWAGNALVPAGCLTDYRCWANGSKLYENPSGGKRVYLRYLSGFSTYDTASTFNVYSVKMSQKAAGASTATNIYQIATGASTANATAVDLSDVGIWGRPNEKLIVRIESSTNTSTYTVRALGEEYPVQ